MLEIRKTKKKAAVIEHTTVRSQAYVLSTPRFEHNTFIHVRVYFQIQEQAETQGSWQTKQQR